MKPSPARLLVTHPGRQHSHQAALGLARAGMLAGYWAGVPALPRPGWAPAALWRRLVRYEPVALPPGLVRWQPAVPALRRTSEAVLPRRGAQEADLAACRLLDRWAAAGLDRAIAEGADGVIACEISALATFRAAKRLGLTVILDAPSFHRTAQDRLHGTTDPPGLHRRIATVKDAEVAAADHVLTVSELARETYLEAGVPAAKVHALPLGADLELFAPDGETRPDEAEVTFLFAGAQIRRKGFDLLVEAFGRTVEAGPPGRLPRLRLVGPAGDASPCLERLPEAARARVSSAGSVPQPELAAELRRASCLVLPSRNDSYGLVVAEALATGTPVVVSDMVGAKDLVREGENGWIVPAGDAAALTEQLQRCAADPAALAAMRRAARESARAATWEAYHERLVDLLARLVPRRGR